MNKCILPIVILLGAMSPSGGLAQHSSREDIPRRILLNLTATPARSMAVTWRTIADVNNARAQITAVTDSAVAAATARSYPATSIAAQSGRSQSGVHHSVILASLLPGTKYAYRVGHDSAWSEWSQFTTAAERAAPFEFVFLGDPQNSIKSQVSRLFHEALVQAPRAAFWLFTGDLIGMPQYDSLWDELFQAAGFIFTMIPSVMVPGNHEYIADGDKGPKHLVPLWRSHFSLPWNGIAGLEETSYSFDYQGVRIIMINGNEYLEEQAAWLEDLLSNNPNRWTIVSMHQPVFSVGRERDQRRTRDAFMPLFDRYGVDVVLTGHDHAYARSFKLHNGVPVGAADVGTVYVVSVSGPKAYPLSTTYAPLMEKMGTGMLLFQVLRIDGGMLTFRSYTAGGSLHDSFRLAKD